MKSKDQILLEEAYGEIQNQNSFAKKFLSELFNSFEFISTEKYPTSQSVYNVAAKDVEMINMNERDEYGSYSYDIAFNLPFEVVPEREEDTEDETEQDLAYKYGEMFSDVLRYYSGPGREFSRGSLSKVKDLGNGMGRFTLNVSGGLDI
jgi:hypothetical protein